jgi:hypothetical protein
MHTHTTNRSRPQAPDGCRKWPLAGRNAIGLALLSSFADRAGQHSGSSVWPMGSGVVAEPPRGGFYPRGNATASCQPRHLDYSARRSGCRRGGRAAEGARLESVYTGNRIEGSNPSPSANIVFFSERCGKSGNNPGGAAALAGRHLRSHRKAVMVSWSQGTPFRTQVTTAFAHAKPPTRCLRRV